MIDVCNSKKPTCCPRLVNSDPHLSQCRLTYQHLRAKNHMPQTPDKGKANFLTLSLKTNRYSFKNRIRRMLKGICQSFKDSMDLQQNCPVPKAPLLNYSDCEGRRFITMHWLNSLLFGLALPPLLLPPCPATAALYKPWTQGRDKALLFNYQNGIRNHPDRSKSLEGPASCTVNEVRLKVTVFQRLPWKQRLSWFW